MVLSKGPHLHKTIIEFNRINEISLFFYLLRGNFGVHKFTSTRRWWKQRGLRSGSPPQGSSHSVPVLKREAAARTWTGWVRRHHPVRAYLDGTRHRRGWTPARRIELIDWNLEKTWFQSSKGTQIPIIKKRNIVNIN